MANFKLKKLLLVINSNPADPGGRYGTRCGMGVSDFDTEALKKEFPEFAPAEIVVLMLIGHPAEDSQPIAWHSEKRPAAELFSTL